MVADMSSQMMQFRMRNVTVLAFEDIFDLGFPGPFAALVVSDSKSHIDAVMHGAAALVQQGCVELCCVGALSENLHDRLDDWLEAAGRLDIITTWHEDLAEGAEYFLFGAGAQRLALVAVVADCPDIVATLMSVAETV
jgi:hypothetical protein